MNPLFKSRFLKHHGKTIPIYRSGKAEYQVVVPDDADDWTIVAAGIICRAIRLPEDRMLHNSEMNRDLPTIFLSVEPDSFQGTPADKQAAFNIFALKGIIRVTARTSWGLAHAARVFTELVYPEGENLHMPEVTIWDYPDLAYRGIYVECRWGPDNMTLDEWKEAIDTLASMRMNVMSIGLYNNWPIQYDGKISEWMMVPIKKYPKLKTPKLVSYYSPSGKQDVRLEYVPRMYEEDLFGEIVKYGKSRGVLVRPHFNTPGHNTQIPRNYPETSAKFADGAPKKYGFCMSSPATYEVMFGIFDEICDRYLLPNGVDWFHIGLDEVYPLVGMNEDTPMLRIDPWCECPECAKKSKDDHFVDYAVRLAKHLKDKGINNIGMWHDHFARGGKMNTELARRFEEEGLKENAVLHWWRYSDFFDTTMPELGLRRWVTPMTGYFYWVNYQNHLDNCFLAAEKGVEENAEGTEAYGVFHKPFHQHYALLAAKSWNSENWPDAASFRREYARLMFGKRWREGLRGFKYFDDITAGIGTLNFLTRLLRYMYSYAGTLEAANHRDNYPRPLIEELIGNPVNILGFLSQVSGYAQKALDIFSQEGLWADVGARSPRPEQGNPAPTPWVPAGMREIYLTECLRIKAILDLFPRMVNAVKLFRSGADEAKLSEAADAVDSAVEQLEEAILAIENTWTEPFIPQALRELTLLRGFAVDLSGELRAGPGDELKVMVSRPVDWPND